MSNPLIALRKILNLRAEAETGTVTSVSDVVTVATRNGTVQLVAAMPVSVGDCVLIRGGVVQGKIQKQSERPAYHL